MKHVTYKDSVPHRKKTVSFFRNASRLMLYRGTTAVSA